MIGNIEICNRWCRYCGGMMKHERNAMLWGAGDLLLMLMTCFISIPLKFLLYWASGRSSWRCHWCGRSS